MKTFEIMERIYENAEAMLGKKYKLTATPDANCEMAIGDEAFIGKTTSGLVTFFYKNGFRITCLTGFEEWEEAKEPKSFMELLELIKQTGRASLRFSYEDTIEDYKFTGFLDDFLSSIGDTFTSDYIAEKLLRGKFYIED